MASKMQQKKPRKPQRFKQLLNKFTAICSHLLGGEAEDRLYELALAGQTASHKSTKIFGLGCKLQKSTNQTDQVADGTTLGPKARRRGADSSYRARSYRGHGLIGDQSEDNEKRF
jgi:hypothetical protein